MTTVVLFVLSLYQFDNSPVATCTAAPVFESNGIAVVELFTSQGCSSCPPADRLLEQLSAEAAQTDKALYALSFHVDYWDYLGWKDPYSQSIFSDRQRTYAHKWNTSRVYTPQMVVNGRQAFVGSDEQKARSHIQNALSQTAPVRIDIQIDMSEDLTHLLVTTELDSPQPGQLLQLAIVEKKVGTAVNRGENAGRKLSHAQVVRQFRTVPLGKENQGPYKIDFPADIPAAGADLVVYVQDANSWEILGANAMAIYTDE